MRKIPKVPFKVLDAPELQDDFYLNLVDWSSTNVLGVGLGTSVAMHALSIFEHLDANRVPPRLRQKDLAERTLTNSLACKLSLRLPSRPPLASAALVH